MSSRRDEESSVAEAESILERLAATALDDDYYVDHEKPPGNGAKALTGLAIATIATMLTVAAVQTRIDRPATEAERDALIENIRLREDLVANKQETVAGLQGEIADLQAESVVDGPGTVAVRVASGAVPVEGPGLTITVQSSANEDRPGGRLTDADLQLVVNGLWLAGAEAVSVGGHRLTSTSAIRSAGEAITVNYRSVTEPVVVAAIGDESTLETQWQAGPSGRYLDARAEADGLRYDVRGSDDVELAAAPESRLKVSAEPLRRSAS